MKILPALLLVAAPAIAAEPLAPPRAVQQMLGVVSVYDASEEEKCGVILYEDETPGGYVIHKYDGCEDAFPVMRKVAAWRAYQGGELSFADADGHDLVRFRGEGYTRDAVTPVDGIVKLWSAQEANE